MVDIKDTLFQKFKDQIGQGGNLKQESSNSTPPNLIDFDNQFGYTIYALGQCLFVFDGLHSFNLLTSQTVDPASLIDFHLKFESNIQYIQISGQYLIVCEKSTIHVFDKESFYIQKQQSIASDVIKIDSQSNIRQISCNQNGNILIVLQDFSFYEFFEKKIYKSQVQVKSAIYNQKGDQIVALPFQNPGQETTNIYIFQSGSNFQKLSEMKLDFPKESKRNFFNAYYITDYKNGTTAIFSAIYENDEDQEENVGMPLVFIINQEINDQLSIERLKQIKNGIKYFYITDYQHSNDDLDKLPALKLLNLCKPQRQGDVDVLILFTNHLEQPYIFIKHFDNQIENCVYEKMNYNPYTNRPNDLSAQECLGCTLGGFIVQCFIDESMKHQIEKKVLMDDNDEDKWSYPPILTIYGSDGRLHVFQIFVTQFKDNTILQNVQLPKQIKFQQQNTVELGNQKNQKEEEKKQEFKIDSDDQINSSGQQFNSNKHFSNPQNNPQSQQKVINIVEDAKQGGDKNKFVNDLLGNNKGKMNEEEKKQSSDSKKQPMKNPGSQYVGQNFKQDILDKQKSEKDDYGFEIADNEGKNQSKTQSQPQEENFEIQSEINQSQQKQQQPLNEADKQNQRVQDQQIDQQHLIQNEQVLQFQQQLQRESEQKQQLQNRIELYLKRQKDLNAEGQHFQEQQLQINPILRFQQQEEEKKIEIEVDENKIRQEFLFQIQCNENEIRNLLDQATRQAVEQDFNIFRRNFIMKLQNEEEERRKDYIFEENKKGQKKSNYQKYIDEYNRIINNQDESEEEENLNEEEEFFKIKMQFIFQYEGEFAKIYNQLVIGNLKKFQTQIFDDVKILPQISQKDIDQNDIDKTQEILGHLENSRNLLIETGNYKQALIRMKNELNKGQSLKENNFQIDYLLSKKNNVHDYIISLLKDTQNSKSSHMNQQNAQIKFEQQNVHDKQNFQNLLKTINNLKVYEQNRDKMKFQLNRLLSIQQVINNKQSEELNFDQLKLKQIQSDVKQYLEKEKRNQESSSNDIDLLKYVSKQEIKILENVKAILDLKFNINQIFIKDVNDNIEKRFLKINQKISRKQPNQNQTKYGDLENVKENLIKNSKTNQDQENIQVADKAHQIAKMKRALFLRKYKDQNYQAPCQQIELQKNQETLMLRNDHIEIKEFIQQLDQISVDKIKEQNQLILEQMKNRQQLPIIQQAEEEEKQLLKIDKPVQNIQKSSLKERLFVPPIMQKIEEKKETQQKIESTDPQKQEIPQSLPSPQQNFNLENLKLFVPEEIKQSNEVQQKKVDPPQKLGNDFSQLFKNQPVVQQSKPEEKKEEVKFESPKAEPILPVMTKSVSFMPQKKDEIQAPKIQEKREEQQAISQNQPQQKEEPKQENKQTEQDKKQVSQPISFANKESQNPQSSFNIPQNQNQFGGFGQKSFLPQPNGLQGFGNLSASQIAQNQSSQNQNQANQNTFGNNFGGTNKTSFSSTNNQNQFSSKQPQNISQNQQAVSNTQFQSPFQGNFFSGQQQNNFQSQNNLSFSQNQPQANSLSFSQNQPLGGLAGFQNFNQNQQFGGGQFNQFGNSQQQNNGMFENQKVFVEDSNKNLAFQQPMNLQANQFQGAGFGKARK